MEHLKSFPEICEPDIRQTFLVRLNMRTGESRKKTLQDVYNDVEPIKLCENVPERVRSHFETARNLFVYSWFVYPFNVVAELQAYASLEYGLKERFRVKKGGLSKLLMRAINEGLISDHNFQFYRVPIMSSEEETGNAHSDLSEDQKKVVAYCKILQEILPKFRNDLAHGSSTLHDYGLGTLRICADLINQLFMSR